MPNKNPLKRDTKISLCIAVSVDSSLRRTGKINKLDTKVNRAKKTPKTRIEF